MFLLAGITWGKKSLALFLVAPSDVALWGGLSSPEVTADSSPDVNCSEQCFIAFECIQRLFCFCSILAYLKTIDIECSKELKKKY